MAELYQWTFAQTPLLASCEMFKSFDGCGRLTFAFDQEGCLITVAPGPSGWKGSAHLVLLQECLTDALQSARFPCLASGELKYEESCYVR